MWVFFIFTSSCEKELVPVVSTTVVSNVTEFTATSGGDISDEGSSTVLIRGICWSIDTTPTISDKKTNDGTGAGVFSSNLSGLSSGTTYYVRAYATNSIGTSYGSAVSVTTKEESPGSFTDQRDGYVYKTVTIGNQEWMAENLRHLPDVEDAATGSQIMPYHYVHGYNGTFVAEAKATDNYKTYGALYNWPAAKAACPDGWHLPTNTEWTELIDYLGGQYVAGGKLKETGTTHWESPNTGATNESGFTALPGGDRCVNDKFSYLGLRGFWWNATEGEHDPNTTAWFYGMDWIVSRIESYYDSKEIGFSVRCVRDK